MPDKNDTTPCGFAGCWNTATFKATGLCQSHQLQHRSGAELRPLQSRGNQGPRTECAHEGCEAYARTRGFCKSHYMKFLRTGQTYGPGSAKHCSSPGCNRAVDVRGFCERHYREQDAVWKGQRSYACLIPNCTGVGQYGICALHSTRAGRFGLKPTQLQELIAGGVCDACGVAGDSMHIHHDHSCCDRAGRSCGGCVTAYLCSGCNTAAGMAKDDPDRLRKLADVLERGSRFPENPRTAKWTA